MSYNIFSAMSNIGFGLMGNITHANGRTDYDMGHAMKALRIMLKATSHVGDTTKKIAALMNRYNVLFEVNEAAYDSSRAKKGKMKIISPYEIQRRSEYFVQGMSMVATMLKRTIKDKNNKEHPLFEAYDVNGKLKDNFKTDENNKDWEGSVDNEGDLKKYMKLRNNIVQVNKRIHGNYDPDSPVQIKKWVLGRMLMQFRSWISEGFATRIEKNKYDEST